MNSSTAQRADSLPPDQQRTVLLADSDPNVRSALCLLLARERELRVVGEAADLEDLLACAAVIQPDLVLLDWDLPGMTTDGALPALRARCPRVVVIALSLRPERCQEIRAAGAQACVSKVDAPARLLAALRSATGAPPHRPEGDVSFTASSGD